MSEHIIDTTLATWNTGQHRTALKNLIAFIMAGETMTTQQATRVLELQEALLTRSKGKNFNLRSAMVKFALDVAELKLKAKRQRAAV